MYTIVCCQGGVTSPDAECEHTRNLPDSGGSFNKHGRPTAEVGFAGYQGWLRLPMISGEGWYRLANGAAGECSVDLFYGATNILNLRGTAQRR